MPKPSLDEIFGQQSSPQGRPSLDSIFRAPTAQKPMQPQQKESVARTAIDQGLQGATFGFADEITDRIGAGIASLATDEKYSDLLKEARGNTNERFARQMEQNPVTSIGANIGGALLTGGAAASTKAGGAVGNMLRTGGLPARIAKGAAAGAASGGLYGTGAGQEGGRLEGAGQGTAFGGIVGGAVPAVGAAYRGVKNAATPMVDDGLREIGKLAQKYDIPLSLDQVSNSRALKNVQKISQEIPLSGQSGFRDKQMKAFNRALFKTVGVNADSFTPRSMDVAFKKVGGEFDNLTRGKQFNIGGNFIDDLASTVDDVASTYGDDAARIFQKEASKVINDFGSGDTISGNLISRQRARINGLARKASDPNIKGALLDLENVIVDGITSKNPASQAALTGAKQRYKNLIVLEPIANKSKGGMISPSLLNSRVSQVYKRAHTIGKSGEIGDLARIGHELLPQLGGSDTTQKMAYIGALSTGAINPASIPAIAGGVGVNRAFQAGINRNQSLIGNALNRTALPATTSGSAAGSIAGGVGGAAASTERNALQIPSRTEQGLPPQNYQPSAPVELKRPDTVKMEPMSYNTDDSFLDDVKQAESSGDPNAKNPDSSASGLYQFTDRTWRDSVAKWGKKHGITVADKNKPEAQEKMVRELAADNARILTNKLDAKPTKADMYTAHFMGAPQAVRLIKMKNSRAIAAKVFPTEAKSNRAIFYDNGKPRTVAEVYQFLAKKVS